MVLNPKSKNCAKSFRYNTKASIVNLNDLQLAVPHINSSQPYPESNSGDPVEITIAFAYENLL